MRRLMLLICAVGLAGCGGPNRAELTADFEAAVEAFYAAVEAGDVEARAALFHPDAMLLPNHWTLLRGGDAVRDMIRSGADWVFRLRDREQVDMEVRDGIAYTVNSYYYTWHAPGDEPRWHKTKNVHIWKLDDAGEWRLYLDIWNSDVPLAAFADE